MKAPHENLVVSSQFVLIGLAILLGVCVLFGAAVLLGATATTDNPGRVTLIIVAHSGALLTALAYCIFGTRKVIGWVAFGILISPPILLFLVSGTTHA